MDALAKSPKDSINQLVTNGQRALSYSDSEVALRRPLGEIAQAILDAAGKSPHTRRSYLTSMALFLAYLEQQRGHLIPPGYLPLVEKLVSGVALAVTEPTGRKKVEYRFGVAPCAVLRLVDQGLLDGFAAWRITEGDSPNTASIRLYAVRTFLSVALRENVLTTDQAQNMGLESYKSRNKRDQKPVGRRLSMDEVQALRAVVDTRSKKGKRDILILDLGLYLGLREAEIAGLRMDDFTQDGGSWFLVFAGKGSKTRKLKLSRLVLDSLEAWRAAAGLEWHTDHPLFYSVDKWGNMRDSQITPTDVSRAVAFYGARAGISTPKGAGRLGAHDLRRTAARNAYDNGASLLLVQRMLGHSDPKTTAQYIGLDDTNGESAADFIRYE